MSKKNHHIIRKQIIELDLPSQGNAFVLQNQLMNLCKAELSQAMEEVFDEFVPSHQTLRIPRLEIDLGDISSANLEKVVVEKFKANLKKQLQEKHDFYLKTAEAGVKPSEDIKNILSYFLQFGRLPWYARFKTIEELEDKIIHW